MKRFLLINIVSLILFICCCSEAVIIWEFSDAPPSSSEIQCTGEGFVCKKYLTNKRYKCEEHDPSWPVDEAAVCCWECRDDLNFCLELADVWPGKVSRYFKFLSPTEEYFDVKWCDKINPGDLNYGPALGDMTLYRFYLKWLIRSYGSEYEIGSDDIILFGFASEDLGKMGDHRDMGDGTWSLRVNIPAHINRPIGEVYNTIAHEYKHVEYRKRGIPLSVHHSRMESENWPDKIAPLDICGE